MYIFSVINYIYNFPTQYQLSQFSFQIRKNPSIWS